MAEFAAVDQFQASEPQTIPVAIPQLLANPPGQVVFYETSAPSLWRIRHVSIFGSASGGAGSIKFTLQGLISGLVGDPWTNGGPLVAASPVDVAFGDSYHITWNTEIADNYSGKDSDFGQVVNLGLPLLFLPGLTDISILGTAVGGYNGNGNIDGGQMEIEKFPPGSLSGDVTGGAGGNVYLLPQTI